MTERKIKLADPAARSESGELLTERDHLLLHQQRSLAGLVMRSAREFDQAARPLLLIAA